MDSKRKFCLHSTSCWSHFLTFVQQQWNFLFPIICICKLYNKGDAFCLILYFIIPSSHKASSTIIIHKAKLVTHNFIHVLLCDQATLHLIFQIFPPFFLSLNPFVISKNSAYYYYYFFTSSKFSNKILILCALSSHNYCPKYFISYFSKITIHEYAIPLNLNHPRLNRRT